LLQIWKKHGTSLLAATARDKERGKSRRKDTSSPIFLSCQDKIEGSTKETKRFAIKMQTCILAVGKKKKKTKGI